MQQFLVEQLRTLYDAEKQLTKALPRMAKAASDEELANGFRQHAEQTKEQAARIEQIFQELGVKARGATCAPMQALIEEGQQIIASEMEDSIRDIGLASAARRVEHFEIAAYDALSAAAQATKQTEVAQLLQETLREVMRCTREGITINTFMLEQSPFMIQFVNDLMKINSGRVFIATPERLGEYILVDYVAHKQKWIG